MGIEWNKVIESVAQKKVDAIDKKRKRTVIEEFIEDPTKFKVEILINDDSASINLLKRD